MPNCKHCGDRISGKEQCEHCDTPLADQCACCHEEVAHGVIRNMNIHLCGNQNTMTIDEDLDAFGRSGPD